MSVYMLDTKEVFYIFMSYTCDIDKPPSILKISVGLDDRKLDELYDDWTYSVAVQNKHEITRHIIKTEEITKNSKYEYTIAEHPCGCSLVLYIGEYDDVEPYS